MGKQTGKPQSVISRLENDEYGRVTLKSLLDIASGMDVALVVQFVSYPEFLRRYSDFSDAKLQPATIHESIERAQSAGIAELTAYETTKRALETVIASPGEINWYGLVKAAGTDRLITDQRIADLRVN